MNVPGSPVGRSVPSTLIINSDDETTPVTPDVENSIAICRVIGVPVSYSRRTSSPPLSPTPAEPDCSTSYDLTSIQSPAQLPMTDPQILENQALPAVS